MLGHLECMVTGAGAPLVLLPGLSPENGRPVGVIRAGEVQTMKMFASRFTTYWVGRPVGLQRGTTMADLTAVHARSLAEEFNEPVDVVGISTGGALAQQLAAEHPEVVRRLALISTGYRLGGYGASTQRAMIEVAERGSPRHVMAAYAWDLVPPWRGRSAVAALMYMFGLKLYPRARNVGDLHATLEAEDAFDLRTLPTITAPTLIINGGKDRFYELEIIRETARLIPNSRLIVYPDRGHVTVVSDRRAIGETVEFLSVSDG
jgi:pimeloyl-ACP methyl ester carboxylesterase